ncbi:MAG: CapA family protein, partial [Methanosphaera sp.]|nr:CapA family protein [Methanosphaera sp.]
TATLYPVYISGYLPQLMESVGAYSLLIELNPKCVQMKITDDGHGVIHYTLGNETNSKNS